jgi:hypothetical protein
MSYRAPPGDTMRSAAPATRQAAGVPSAWSQRSQSIHERPRRWCDAGPLRRVGVTADQKAGEEGRVRNGDRSQRQRPGQGQGPYPCPWVIEPTRIGTPPSPTGRRRYKHRSAVCSARVSRAMKPTPNRRFPGRRDAPSRPRLLEPERRSPGFRPGFGVDVGRAYL